MILPFYLMGQSKTDTASKQTIEVKEGALIKRNKTITDSVKQVMQQRIDSLKKVADSLNKASIQSKNLEESKRLLAKSDSLKTAADTLKVQANLKYLKNNARPVVLNSDTLFYVYAQLGSYSPEDRASNVESKLKEIVRQFNYIPDSLIAVQSELAWSISYEQKILLSILPEEARVQNLTQQEVASKYLLLLKPAMLKARKQNSVRKYLIEIGWVVLILVFVYLLYRLINFVFKFIIKKVEGSEGTFFKGIQIRGYLLVAPNRQLRLTLFLIRAFRLLVLLIVLYLTLPMVFSVFPPTKNIADTLLSYLLTPLKKAFASVLKYVPHLFDIGVIVVCTRYVLKALYFFADEIEHKKLTIQGFHSDWARPTLNIVRVIVYGFMFVLIFPHLPGSDSTVFRGVSVFFGLLLSLGSSSAISNIVAGLVITYMRPFKISDRVKIGDVAGDVVEKNLLVTRIRTVKNEEITIPNASILSGHTINFTSSNQYLIHSTVTIGYDVPWRQVHEILIDAASSASYILKDPKPFVLQTSLDDFYVSYEINAYISDTTKIAEGYSKMHQFIQDKFNEAGVEILSPHYRAVRDGGQQTNPVEYLPKDYQSPPFKVMKID